MKTRLTPAACAVAIALLPSTGSAQGQLADLATDVTNGRFGFSSANAGDLTGDGIDDLVVGAPFDTSSGTVGSVYVLDGAAAQAGANTIVMGPIGFGTSNLCTQSGLFDQFGFSVDAGMDIDGDSVPDIVVGESGAGNVYALSGATGANILAGTGQNLFRGCGTQHGYKVRLLNADGDSAADVLVIDRPSLIGQVARFRVYSGAWIASGGATGTKLLFTGTSAAAQDIYGAGVAILGDLDGDGRDEFAIGAAGTAPGLPGGYVDVWSSGTASMLARFQDPNGSTQQERFGESLAAMGDYDGDGIGDLLVGARRWNVGGGSDFEGRIEVVSGAWILSPSGATRTLSLVEGTGDEEFGRFVHSADVNNDGSPDVIATFDTATGGSGARVFSGRTSSVMYEIVTGEEFFGTSMSSMPDGSGITNIAYGAPNYDEVASLAGKIELRRGLDAAGILAVPGTGCPCVDAAPAGCQNSTGRGGLLAAEGGTAVLTGGSLVLTGTGMSNSQPVTAFCGLPGTVMPLGNGLFGLSAQQRVGLGGTDANGTIVLNGDPLDSYQTLTFSSLVPGDTIRFQLVYRDLDCTNPSQASFNWTNAYEVVVR